MSGLENPVLGQGQDRIVFSAAKKSGPRTDFPGPRPGLDCVRAGPGPNRVFRRKRNPVLGLIFPVLGQRSGFLGQRSGFRRSGFPEGQNFRGGGQDS